MVYVCGRLNESFAPFTSYLSLKGLYRKCPRNISLSRHILQFQDNFNFFLIFFQFFKMVSNFSRLLPILQQKIHSILLWDSLEWLENLLKEQKEPIMTNLSGSCSIFQEGLIMCFMFVVDQMNNLLLTHCIYLWKACIKRIYKISVFQDIFCNFKMVSISFIIVSNFSRWFPIFQDSFQFFKTKWTQFGSGLIIVMKFNPFFIEPWSCFGPLW